MSAPRVTGAKSPLFLNTLLLSTALSLPAMAQIEEVVVTAQKKTENVQNVPIAVTAFTAQDLQARQIQQPKDLQFASPNVNYTGGFFGPADFQIRGIGITAVGYGAESGIAVNYDEVFLSAPNLSEGTFFDLSGIEVLAGPQSTLYGRGATGGAVNVNIMKPDLTDANAQLSATFGNYATYKTYGYVNIPIIDNQLGIRIAGAWDQRDGFVTNIADGQKFDNLSQYSVRPTLRWQPSQKTTVDITGTWQWEDDNHMRADKLFCDTDPTGILGCLPNERALGNVNDYAQFGPLASSQQGFQSVFAAIGPLLGLTPAQQTALADEIGLFNLQAQNVIPPAPQGDRQIDVNFVPRWISQDNFLSFKWQQNVMDWLDSTFIAGYDRTSYFSQQAYANLPSIPLPSNTNGLAAACAASLAGSPNLQCSEATFLGFINNVAALLGGSPAAGAAYAGHFAPFFNTIPGSIPISGVGNLGTTGGNFTLTPNNQAFDQSDGTLGQYSFEWRLATSLKGPLNGMLGLYYLHNDSHGDYYVLSSTIDYPSILLGGIGGLVNPACQATGCIQAPSYYHNVGVDDTLISKAMFGEVYYDIIPDELKLTGGLRYTQDDKFNSARIIFLSQLVPIGTTSENAIPTTPGTANGLLNVRQTFDAWTGRAVLNWTPKLSFTDQTMIYLSYATGYKAGGANPGVQPNLASGVSNVYSPENIIAYEIGTKNLLLGSTLQANGDFYYYVYRGLQVSAILENTSVNDNVAARAYGAEGNLLWQATDRWQLGLNIAQEHSAIENTTLLDPANPTGNNPHTLLIKDDTVSSTAGQNCVLYFNGAFPGLPAGYVAPAGGVHALAASGIPNVAFGSCNLATLTAAAASAGYNTPTVAGNQSFAGQAISLNGNALQITPQIGLSASVQYTQPLPSDYTLTARIDAHWQSHMWGTIFQDRAAFIGDEVTANASLQINPPTDIWYVQFYVRNIFNANNITGEYVASQSSGLYTSAFYGDPRTYAVQLGLKL